MKTFTVIFSILFCLGFTQNTFAENLRPLPDAELEIVATLEKGPGNIAVTPQGMIIISLHQFYDTEYRVMELLHDGRLAPFPNEDWSRPSASDGTGLNAVLGLRADRRASASIPSRSIPPIPGFTMVPYSLTQTAFGKVV
jgi:hypothetical protein